MIRRFTTCVLLTSTPLLDAGLIPIGEHADIVCHWSAGAWNCEVMIESDEIAYDPASVFMVLSDRPYLPGNPAASGARLEQPESPAFAFTGAQPGEPLWAAVQGTPGNGEAWPGFNNEQAPSTFGSYIPADSRLSQSTPRPWIRVDLLAYQPPHGKDSHFSMWSTESSGAPTVWMSTYDTEVQNSYYFPAGSHTHANWGFTQQGVHRLTLRVSAFAGPGATNPTGFSAPFTLTFAVGTFGQWQARNFNLAQLANPGTCGPGSDPDADGLTNLAEYAFGTDPLRGGRAPIANGLGLPTFSINEENGIFYQTVRYPRRRQGERVAPEIYQPLFAESPAGPWTDAGVTSTAADYPPSQAALNAEWELVTSRRPLPAGAKAGFARVAVTPGDGL